MECIQIKSFSMIEDVFINLYSPSLPKFIHCLLILIHWFIWKFSGPLGYNHTTHYIWYIVLLTTSHNNLIFCILYVCCFTCMYIHVLLVYLILSESRRGHMIPWNWSSRQFRVATWVLRIKPSSSGRTAKTLSCGAISPAPSYNSIASQNLM